jgi:glycosyltransferase involved in cell wall biosynthesis
MEYKPLVSIIIPLYNAEAYIGDTIISALDQTWPNKQIIIVDDGSTDNSLAVARQYQNDRVSIFAQENQGSSFARNFGLQQAKGEYIQFLDADDLLSTNKIEEQVKLLLNHPSKVAVCSTIHFNTTEDPFGQSPNPYEEAFLFDTDSPADFLINLYGGDKNQGSMIQTNAWLTPANVIKKAGNWSEFYSPDDDGEFFCRVLLASSGIVHAKKCFNYYRKFNSNSNLAGIKNLEAFRGKFKSFLLKKQYLLAATDTPLAKKALAHSAMELAVDSYSVDKDLYNEIMQEINCLGGTSYIPILGGPKIEMIKKLFGWKLALWLKNITLSGNAN